MTEYKPIKNIGNIGLEPFIKAFEENPNAIQGKPFITHSINLTGWAKPAFRQRVLGQVNAGSEIIASSLESRIYHLENTIESLREDLASCIGRVNTLCSELEDKSTIKNINLLDLDEKHTVMQPISIIIEESEDKVIARFPEVELFSIGDTESEALLKLKLAITELYSDLMETPKGKLGKLPAAWLRVLKKVIKSNG